MTTTATVETLFKNLLTGIVIFKTERAQNFFQKLWLHFILKHLTISTYCLKFQQFLLEDIFQKTI